MLGNLSTSDGADFDPRASSFDSGSFVQFASIFVLRLGVDVGLI